MSFSLVIPDSANFARKSRSDCRKVTPTISVDDPLLMLGMPKGLTAATGMDALTHAIEAYVSTASTPVTDACALHAMRLVSNYLRTAVLHGDNLEARDMMRYSHTSKLACFSAGHCSTSDRAHSSSPPQ